MEVPNEVKTMNEDRLIFEVRASDIQDYAQSRLGRPLTKEELDRACGGVDEGLSSAAWSIFHAAIQNVTDEEPGEDADAE